MKRKKSTNSISQFLKSISGQELNFAAAICVGAYFAAPLIMAILCMFIRKIDFIANNYPKFIGDWVGGIAYVIFAFLLVIQLGKLLREQMLLKTIKENPIIILVTITVLIMFVSQCVNGLQYAVEGYKAASLQETFPMQLGYVALLLPGATFVTLNYKKILVRMFNIMSIVLVIAAFVLWHTQIESSFFYDWTPRYSSIFTNTNYYGYFLAIAVPAAACAYVMEKDLAWRIVSLVSLIANSIALSINDTTGAWVGCVAAVLFIVIATSIVEKKFLWRNIVVIVVFALCLYIPGHILGSFEATTGQLGKDIVSVVTDAENAGSAGSSRWKIWNASLDIVKENPIFGIGFEGVLYWHYVGPPYNIRPHNEFIQHALFYGIPMVVAYFIMCFAFFIRALRLKRKLEGVTLTCLAGAFGYLVSSFFGLTIYATAPYLFLFLGMGYVNSDAPEKDEK